MEDESHQLLVLDLTNAHLHSLQEIELPSSTSSIEHVDLTANRLSQIEPYVLNMENLKSLSLRQNILQDASAVSQLKSAEHLTRLELRDNQLRDIPDLSRFQSLEYLELSYNIIKDMSAIAKLWEERKDDSPHPLKELFLANNGLKRIQGLEGLGSNLTHVELGSNKINSMHGLEALHNMHALWLGSNRIERIDIDLASCCAVSLKQLSLQSNRLTSMEGLEGCVALEELYVSDNGITELCNLERLVNLKVLDVSYNRLESLHGVRHLASTITDVWANNNLIDDFDEVENELIQVKDTLSVLYLAGNPFVERHHTSYKLRMKHALPKLEQLDDTFIIQ
jgi:protein phosphatase 1 regulatory subunit 7